MPISLMKKFYSNFENILNEDCANDLKISQRHSISAIKVPQSRSTRQYFVKNKNDDIEKGYFYRKNVVITGASSGLGEELSYYYLNLGAHVFLVAQDRDRLKNIARDFPNQATVIIADITNDSHILDLVESVRLEILSL